MCTAAIQFPLSAAFPSSSSVRCCNTPARRDSKRSADVCTYPIRSMRTMLVPLLQQRRRKARLPLPSPRSTILLSLFDDVFRACKRIHAPSIGQLARETLFTRVHEMSRAGDEEEWRRGEGIGEIDRDEFSPSHPVYRMGK